MCDSLCTLYAVGNNKPYVSNLMGPTRQEGEGQILVKFLISTLPIKKYFFIEAQNGFFVKKTCRALNQNVFRS